MINLRLIGFIQGPSVYADNLDLPFYKVAMMRLFLKEEPTDSKAKLLESMPAILDTVFKTSRRKSQSENLVYSNTHSFPLHWSSVPFPLKKYPSEKSTTELFFSELMIRFTFDSFTFLSRLSIQRYIS